MSRGNERECWKGGREEEGRGESTGPESILIDIIEIIRGVRNIDGFMAEPRDILYDGIKVFVLFGLWVGIVESQYRLCRDALPPRCLCLPKVEGHCFRMPEVKVAIWLRWKARPVPASSLFQIRHQILPWPSGVLHKSIPHT
jgi:hypothetical protein